MHTGLLLREKKGTGIFSFRILPSRWRTALPCGSYMVRGCVNLPDGLHATRCAILPSRMALTPIHAPLPTSSLQSWYPRASTNLWVTTLGSYPGTFCHSSDGGVLTSPIPCEPQLRARICLPALQTFWCCVPCTVSATLRRTAPRDPKERMSGAPSRYWGIQKRMSWTE